MCQGLQSTSPTDPVLCLPLGHSYQQGGGKGKR